MALSHKARKRWSLVVLLLGVPVYIGLIVGIMGLVYDNYGQPPFLVELFIYVSLGVVWALPLKWLFIGVGQADPDAPPPDGR